MFHVFSTLLPCGSYISRALPYYRLILVGAVLLVISWWLFVQKSSVVTRP